MDDDVLVGMRQVAGRADEGRRHRVGELARQCRGHLLHLVVEQRIGFLARLAVDQHGGNGNAREQSRGQPPQQGSLDGTHQPGSSSPSRRGTT
ncbi:hypothetical protein D3C73_1420840 [compost metagenome]